MTMTNIAIFVSGSGSNCENIIRYFQHHDDIASGSW
jgi:phosphoribosylglycinamide formyltransferase-1